MEAQTYKCAECGRPATVENGEIERTCEHADAGVAADMEAVAYGVGGMES
jgi:hypothetical protein